MSASQSLPLFPLQSVLFPHSRMNLRVFEARYLDMIGRCMQANAPFGICLIAEGSEVGAPALPHRIGTEALIVDWDMSQPGILGLVVRGGRRFRILEQEVDSQGLLTGEIEWLSEPANEPPAAEFLNLLPLLAVVLKDAGEARIPRPYALDDASWVGYRYAEILPIQPLARQRLLELDDAQLRLRIIADYLTQQGLLKSAS